MNRILCSLTLLATIACPLLSRGESAVENDPAFLPIDKAIDLKIIRPEVNVNIPRFLLKDAAEELNTSTNNPMKGIDVAELVKDVKLIRVVVIEANPKNRAALDAGVKKLRADLEAKWTSVVSVPEENVGIYAMGDPSGETMAGLAVLVHDGGDAVIANIVGKISIGKLIRIASHMNKMPKDLLKKLQTMTNQPGTPPAAEDDTKESKDKNTSEKTDQ